MCGLLGDIVCASNQSRNTCGNSEKHTRTNPNRQRIKANLTCVNEYEIFIVLIATIYDTCAVEHSLITTTASPFEVNSVLCKKNWSQMTELITPLMNCVNRGELLTDWAIVQSSFKQFSALIDTFNYEHAGLTQNFWLSSQSVYFERYRLKPGVVTCSRIRNRNWNRDWTHYISIGHFDSYSGQQKFRFLEISVQVLQTEIRIYVQPTFSSHLNFSSTILNLINLESTVGSLPKLAICLSKQVVLKWLFRSEI